MQKDYKVQVDASKYYRSKKYDNLERFISYYHQIDEARKISADSILEIGIGGSVVSDYLKNIGKHITTCDFDKNTGAAIISDVRNIGVNDNSFDLVMACQILEHIPFEDFEKALTEIKRVSKKYVIISLPYRLTYFEMIFKFPFIRTLFKRDFFDFTIKKAIKFSGFEKSGQHYWEIDQKQYKLKDVRNKINKYFKILNEFSPILNKYHYFFILELKK